ncbi:hypothetical protein POTOM_010403 [Populus tomentosa]|uniref:Cytochrome P450 n=1 Tax=Populus tomentosa TaxID=118781 RepID=A0A8X8A8G7_POPTO|nr:hypothetical protein POTOM_010403 [Populus tomentosa]
MEYLFYLLLISLTWACLYVLNASVLLRRKSGCTVLPPGPRQLPIIGNILALGDKPHRTLAKLSQTYGPLMTLKLGRITTIVISSPNIAKEALQKHDQALSSRTIADALRGHHENSILWLPASTHWKFLRKLAATQMFTPQRLDASQALRGKKVQELLEYVHENCNNGHAVDIGRSVFTTSLNLISNTFFSLDIANYNSDLSQEFSELVVGVTEQIGKANIADYFPVLRLVDPQGIRRKTNNYFKRLTQIFDSIINERTRPSSSVASKASHDVLDALLILAKENNTELSSTDIQVLLIIADDLTPEDIDTSETFGLTLHKKHEIQTSHSLGKTWSGVAGLLSGPVKELEETAEATVEAWSTGQRSLRRINGEALRLNDLNEISTLNVGAYILVIH